MTNFYEMLGVNRGAEAPEISRAYRRLLQEQYQEMGKEADLSLLSQAHRTLTSPAKRRDYDSKLDLLSGQFTVANPDNPTRAEQAYLDGIKAFDNQNYQEAVQYFARAARLDPGQGHFFSQWGLSIGMFPGRLPEAELYCKKAIELDPDNPVFYFNLGFLYQRHNISEAAQQSFLKAQEAQQVRQAKHAARETVAITVEWRGDTGSLLRELDSIEETMGRTGEAQPEVIALPHADAPAREASSEEIPAAGDGRSGLSGVDDLLSELDSLESSMEKVESYHNGRSQETPAPEAAPLEIVTIKDEAAALTRSGEPEASTDSPAGESPLEIVTAREELDSQMPSGEQTLPPGGQAAEPELDIIAAREDLAPGEHGSPALGDEQQLGPEHSGESPLDLLKELDSIESMVAGLEHSAEAQPAPEPAPEASVNELEDEALKLLQELDVPLDDHTMEPDLSVQVEEANAPVPPVDPKYEGITSEPDAEAIKKKMERLNQMEEQMMEELLKLKAEREKLKADLRV